MVQSHSYSTPQIIGIVFIAIFFVLYVYLIVYLYNDSKPESKTKLKEQVRRRVSILNNAVPHSNSVDHDNDNNDIQGNLPSEPEIQVHRQRRQSVAELVAGKGHVVEDNIAGDNAAAKSVAVVGRLFKEMTSMEPKHSDEPQDFVTYNPLIAEEAPGFIAESTIDVTVTSPVPDDEAVSQKSILTNEHLREIDNLLTFEAQTSLSALQAISQVFEGNRSSPDASPPPGDLVDSNVKSPLLTERTDAIVPSSSINIAKPRSITESNALVTINQPQNSIDISPFSSSKSIVSESNSGSTLMCHCTMVNQINSSMVRKIISIDLSAQVITAESITLIAKLLATPSAVVSSLFLRSCELRDLEAAILGRSLLRNKSLTRLDLSGNKIKKDGCSVLASAFGDIAVVGPNSPKSLSGQLATASQHQRPPVGITVEANLPFTHSKADSQHSRKFNTTLGELNLSANRIGPAGAGDLVKALAQNTSITVIDVGYQRKGFKIGPEGAHKFADLLGSSSCSIMSFKCARNNIGFEGCRHLSSALLRNTSLTELDVGGVNYLTIAGALQLGQAIKCNKLSHLAWLTVGEHRIPISQIVGSQNSEDFGQEVHVYRVESDDSVNYREKAFVSTSRHGMDDELGVVLATLVSHNKQLQTLVVDSAKLPIQELIGCKRASRLDMSNMRLTSIDAIIIGSLIAENSHLKLINLRDNCFGGTEGENFVAYALERNPGLKLDTEAWSAAQMYSDGYPALAALEGMSASGVAIEPQRLEGWFYQGLTVWSAILFYAGLLFDLCTLYTFSKKTYVYFPGWIAVLAVIICSPTAVYLYNSLRNLVFHNPFEALLQALIIICQAPPAILAYEAVLASMESAALLDYKFVQATHKSIPQLYFQTYIMFSVADRNSDINFWSLVSVLSSLLSLTVIFIMLFDRKAARRMSMAPLSDQPYCAVVVARIFEIFGMGTTDDNVKDFVNFDAFYTSHYCLSYVHQLAGLVPRIISITWLLASEHSSMGGLIVLVAFSVRVIIIFLHDDAAYQRSGFNNGVLAISLLITDSAWAFNPADPSKSRECFFNLSLLSSAETFIALYWAYFVTINTKMTDDVAAALFILVVIFVGLRWIMIVYWAVRIHFPKLYLSNHRGRTEIIDNSKPGHGLPRLTIGWNPFSQVDQSKV